MIDRFLEMMSAERGASTHTLEAYRRDLQWAQDELSSHSVSLFSAQKQDLIDLLSLMHQVGFAATSQARRLSTLRQFYQFLYAEGLRADDPSSDIEAPRKGYLLPKVISEDIVVKLLDFAEFEVNQTEYGSKEHFRALRLQVLIEMLYATGLRISELVSLPVQSVRRKEPVILVRGKGEKERIVLLSEKARHVLSQWLVLRDQRKDAGSLYLFPARSLAGYIARQVVARELKNLAKRAGVKNDDFSPHVLRHAFASHLLQNGANLRAVQHLLGHCSISTTQIYTHVLETGLYRLVNEHHPLVD
ncbi:site-specific tyrosine recombinase XerD [Bartonella sp. F02]|uniref:site-specific tyrosine recombinase XerD n=1 Tax=Bartonella sp. F02 TaxID=2967262 RepID=UPI0022A8DA82|nr:site-specific tyrosine recombinase XerD [Bartonella sp. F02]MCZ2327898.1 site-specific tyrosine recombinase XerD [Bartonella sp. F02]